MSKFNKILLSVAVITTLFGFSAKSPPSASTVIAIICFVVAAVLINIILNTTAVKARD